MKRKGRIVVLICMIILVVAYATVKVVSNRARQHAEKEIAAFISRSNFPQTEMIDLKMDQLSFNWQTGFNLSHLVTTKTDLAHWQKRVTETKTYLDGHKLYNKNRLKKDLNCEISYRLTYQKNKVTMEPVWGNPTDSNNKTPLLPEFIEKNFSLKLPTK